MPDGLLRYQGDGACHFVTFSCQGREPLLARTNGYRRAELVLEQMRVRYRFRVLGYVLMPEHVHLLVTEPEKGSLAVALKAWKQESSKLLKRSGEHFWLPRYYDFNVFSHQKMMEKLRYIHRNPVVRGLVTKPEEWAWSSFRHWLNGEVGTVEIESHWTAARREGFVGVGEGLMRASVVPTHPAKDAV